MIRHFIILFSFSVFFIIATQAQYKPAEISHVTIDYRTNITTVYFTGTDHPDVNFYYVMKMINEADGEAIPASYTEDIGDTLFLYEVTLDIPEVTESPVGLYIRPYQDTDTPLTGATSVLKDSTIHLSVDYDWCKNEALLKWNFYNRWYDKNPKYRIYRDVDGITEELQPEPEEGVNEYTVSDLQATREYIFYIRTRLSPLYEISVMSNGVTLDTLETIYPEYLHADYGTVEENNNPTLQFSMDKESDINTYALLRSEQYRGTYDTIDYINSGSSLITYTDSEADASTRPYYYKLVAKNFCNQSIAESENIAGTVYLEGQLNGTTVSLDWTAYHEWPEGVSEYMLERSFEGEGYEFVPTSNDFNHTDNLSNYNTAEHSSRVCYRVTALENPGDPHSPEPASSNSNLYCVNLPMNINFDFNAFTPGEGSGVNEDFGPSMEFLPSFFDFKIFNRSGTIVFHSTDPGNMPRWDGRLRSGTYAPQGVYRCTLQYEDENGNRVVIQQKVTLVRP